MVKSRPFIQSTSPFSENYDDSILYTKNAGGVLIITHNQIIRELREIKYLIVVNWIKTIYPVRPVKQWLIKRILQRVEPQRRLSNLRLYFNYFHIEKTRLVLEVRKLKAAYDSHGGGELKKGWGVNSNGYHFQKPKRRIVDEGPPNPVALYIDFLSLAPTLKAIEEDLDRLQSTITKKQ